MRLGEEEDGERFDERAEAGAFVSLLVQEATDREAAPYNEENYEENCSISRVPIRRAPSVEIRLAFHSR
jgi:hypothetical protein